MYTSLKFVTTVLCLLPMLSLAKVARKPLSEAAPVKSLGDMEKAVQKLDVDLLKAPEVTQDQKSFFAAISYSLFSPKFASESLKSQNQESLGVSASLGYSYTPYSGWGVQGSLGILQNSKTDRSLPDFVLLKPSVNLVFSISRAVYVTGGVFNFSQQGSSLKNFNSYVGQEVFVGYKANKKINIKFGFSVSRFSSDFENGTETVNSLVSIRGLESQLVYLF